ncbi:MAG: type II toxin-antitoxin system VapC family toxin [Chloroflexota bacterium]
MSVHVVDASALGALVFGEPEAEKIATMLSDGLLVAPALLAFELASICLKKIRAHPARKALIMEAFCYATELHIEYVDVDQVSVIALAEETGLTTYDASYLWLARELRGDLVSLDRRLQRAARR